MKNLHAYIDQEKLYRNEGPTGVSNLCKLVRALGYKDYLQNGNLSGGGVLGDLVEFLQDNPGAIEAITNWIDKVGGKEWDDELESQLESSDEDDTDGTCLTCGADGMTQVELAEHKCPEENDDAK